ncbi:hypothetical protein CBR_g34588 [Chara braunii]|uniref:Uncharacterized protein n=1 Tax=Chara braunii TaxID=69332 RepID=A0A388LIZ9_CHABU|nr:hypothetical protein CBR_g34588 [Chara braunii]|eukprot:GBG82304.1 hypothetical protein CBR_g34588 [Chara braunii]
MMTGITPLGKDSVLGRTAPFTPSVFVSLIQYLSLLRMTAVDRPAVLASVVLAGGSVVVVADAFSGGCHGPAASASASADLAGFADRATGDAAVLDELAAVEALGAAAFLPALLVGGAGELDSDPAQFAAVSSPVASFAVPVFPVGGAAAGVVPLAEFASGAVQLVCGAGPTDVPAERPVRDSAFACGGLAPGVVQILYTGKLRSRDRPLGSASATAKERQDASFGFHQAKAHLLEVIRANLSKASKKLVEVLAATQDEECRRKAIAAFREIWLDPDCKPKCTITGS